MPRTPEGHAAMAAELATHSALGKPRVAILLSRYGTRTRDYLAALNGGEETLLPGCPDYAVQEIRHICQFERAMTVDDVIRRRTLIALTGRDTAAVREHIRVILSAVLQAPVMS